MSRSFSIFVATFLVAGAVGANAHQLTSRTTTPGILPQHVAAFAGVSAAQGDDVAAKVKTALKADPDLGAPSDAVTVTGSGGVVTLEGTVPTVQIRAKIAEFVMKVDGVTKVNNKIKLAKK